MKDDLGRENDDDIMIYENAGTRRLLPSSLMAGKPVSISQNAGPSDAMHNSGVGEERTVENDERVIFQAALQVFIFLIIPMIWLALALECSDCSTLIYIYNLFFFFLKIASK